MMKYYWYVNTDTDKIGGFYGSVRPFIKRSISPPIGKPYLIENINGYKHTIKENNGSLISELNDAGNVSEISVINNMIINQLERLIENDRRKKKNEKALSNQELQEEFSSMFFPEEYNMMNLARRKKRVKARLNRSIKKKIIKKKK